mgnify:CR=1 FL=1
MGRTLSSRDSSAASTLYQDVDLLPGQAFRVSTWLRGGSASTVATLTVSYEKGGSFTTLGTLSSTGTLFNIASVIRGSSPRAQDTVIIGAHRDHFGLHGGRLFAGADDNASGT